jgi:hypothetical protein
MLTKGQPQGWAKSAAVSGGPSAGRQPQQALAVRQGGEGNEGAFPVVTYRNEPEAMEDTTARNRSLIPQNPLMRLFAKDEVAAQYWIPDAGHGECGLLEFIKKRTAENTNYVLLQARPVPELAKNFCFPNGILVDLSVEKFRLSKVMQTVKGIDQMIPDQVSGQEIREGVRGQLPELYKNHYYLVKYRDYSSYAINTYFSDSKKDLAFGKRYVEKFFAVRVGANPGCFIPISEAQCLFGWEKILEAYLEDTEAHTGLAPSQRRIGAEALASPTSPKGPRIYLNQMEFESMMALSGPGPSLTDDDARLHQARRGMHQQQDPSGPPIDYPSAWDWTPGAVQKRWQYFVDQQYRRLGRFFFRLGLLCVGVGVAYYCFRRAMGSRPEPTHDPRENRSSAYRRSRRDNGGGAPRDSYGYSDDLPQSLFEAVLSMSPRTLLDYALAPRESVASGRDYRR